VQHSGNGPVIDGFVGVDGLGVIIFDDGVDVSELFQAVFDVGVAAERRLLPCALGEKNSQKAARKKKKKLPGRVTGENYVPS